MFATIHHYKLTNDINPKSVSHINVHKLRLGKFVWVYLRWLYCIAVTVSPQVTRSFHHTLRRSGKKESGLGYITRLWTRGSVLIISLFNQYFTPHTNINQIGVNPLLRLHLLPMCCKYILPPNGAASLLIFRKQW